MKINKKIVKRLSEQNQNESRNLWKHVISSLKAKDLDTATSEKKKLEEKQRADAKMRADQKVAWKTKVCITILSFLAILSCMIQSSLN